MNRINRNALRKWNSGELAIIWDSNQPVAPARYEPLFVTKARIISAATLIDYDLCLEHFTAAHPMSDFMDLARKWDVWLETAGEADRTMLICEALCDQTETVTNDDCWVEAYGRAVAETFLVSYRVGELAMRETRADRKGTRWTRLVARATARKIGRDREVAA